MLNIEDIRSQFPILGTKVYGRPLVYLDSGATAQKPRCVIDEVNRLHTTLNANVHRGVHYLSEQTTELYEAARETVRRSIGAKSRSEIVFTSGATASLNLVAHSWGEDHLGAGDNIVVSEMEHHSNIVPWQLAAQRRNFEIRVLRFDDSGELLYGDLEKLIDGRTRLVAITQASNVLGTRPDLRRIIDAARSVGAVVVVDGCQGVVHGGVDVQALDCDFYAFSGHKLYGPTGIGVLYGKERLLEQMPPFMGGGDMVDRVSFERTTFAAPPLKFEAGTSNYIGAIGLGRAIEWLGQFDPADVAAHERDLLDHTARTLHGIDGLRIYGEAADKCAICSFGIEGAHHYDVGMILDKLGIAVRTGMHCAEPVMTHYGVSGMCRVSLALYNTREEIDRLGEGLRRAVRMLR